MVPLRRQLLGVFVAAVMIAGCYALSVAADTRTETFVEMYIRLCGHLAIEV
jgi:hypothetical protein